MQIALASRSLAPFGGGGIGEYVDTAARLLSQLGEVTIFTAGGHRRAYERLCEQGDPEGLLAAGVDYQFVDDDPLVLGGYYTSLHRYSAGLLDAIVERYPDGGPDFIEVSDYLGEGFVLAQARATLDRRLARSLLAVRIHTTAEICSVLDGHVDPTDFPARMTLEMERYALRHADLLLWPGGDVIGLYERFYGAGRLAEAIRIRNPLLGGAPDAAAESIEETPDGPLRFLYMGRLERRKGVQNLLRAVSSMDNGNWRLTLLGGDTDSGPLGASMRRQLDLLAGEDERITFSDAVPRSELPRIIAEHDVIVLPSLWECWPYVALEAMRMNRPVVATPTGGFVELIEPGVNGWLTEDVSARALAETLDRVCHERSSTLALQARGGPRATVAALADQSEILASYSSVLARPRRTARARVGDPLVSVVVPYFRMAEFVEATVASVLEQTYRAVEVIVVNDGSFGPEDRKLAELSVRYPVSVLTQVNSGLGAARNFGISQSRGRYVLPLDADNMIAPTFLERCVDVLETDDAAAYVTSWSRYVDECGEPLLTGAAGYQPLGNESEWIANDNVAGDAAALIRRRVFDLGYSYSQDLTSFEDWQLYLQLHRGGHFGLVIPERLLLYRVRGDSMIRDIGIPRMKRLWGELQAHTREREVAWAFPSD